MQEVEQEEDREQVQEGEKTFEVVKRAEHRYVRYKDMSEVEGICQGWSGIFG